MSHPDDFTLRARTKQDSSEIVSWVSDSHALYDFSGPRLQWPLTASQLNDMEQVKGLTAWVATQQTGDIFGHFDLTLVANEAHLGRVIIHPAMRGIGLASSLLRMALLQAQTLGAEAVRLNVISTNEPAIRTYSRAGFSVLTGASERQDVTVMIKRLS